MNPSQHSQPHTYQYSFCNFRYRLSFTWTCFTRTLSFPFKLRSIWPSFLQSAHEHHLLKIVSGHLIFCLLVSLPAKNKKSRKKKLNLCGKLNLVVIRIIRLNLDARSKWWSSYYNCSHYNDQRKEVGFWTLRLKSNSSFLSNQTCIFIFSGLALEL